MAITEGKFTVDELNAAITANPDLIKEIKTALPNHKITVLDESEKAAYEDTLTKKTKSELTLQHATEVEKWTKDITGIDKKAPDEKWTEYYTRAMKTQADNLKSLNDQIKGFQGQSNATAAERQQLKELLEERQQLIDGQTKTKSDHQLEIQKLKNQNKILSDISQSDTKLSKSPAFKEPIQIMRERVVDELTEMIKIEGSQTTLIKDGNVLLNADKTIMTPSQYYEKRMENFMDKKKATGAGGTEVDDDGTPTNFRSQTEVHSYLNSKGLVSGTKEFNKEFEKMGASKLPLSL